MTESLVPPNPPFAPDAGGISRGLARLATAVLWAAVLGFGGALLYFIAVPGQRAAGPVSFVFWYASPAVIVLTSAWALRAPIERRVVTALLLVSIVASALVAEAVVRAFPRHVDGFAITTVEADSVCPGEFRRQAGCLAAAISGAPFDRRSTLEVLADLEARGIEAWPSIDAEHYLAADNAIEIDGREVLPLSPGIADVLTVFCNESGDWVTYESDEYGFNNPAGGHRVDEVGTVLVGDSFVHGWCVPYEHTLVGQLRDLDSTVLGVGLEGSGPLVQLGILREYVAPLRPSIVVWVFFEGNDLRDFNREISHGLLIRYLDPDFRQGLRELAPAIDERLREQVSRLRGEEAARTEQVPRGREAARQRRESLGGWIRLTELRSRISDLGRARVPDQPFDPELFGRVAARMRDDVAAWGGDLIFAYMPSQRRLQSTGTANPNRADILQLVGTLGMPVIDLSAPLSEHEDPPSLLPFRVESHLTAEGYGLAARALRDGILAHRAPETE